VAQIHVRSFDVNLGYISRLPPSALPRYNHHLARGITGFPAPKTVSAQGNF